MVIRVLVGKLVIYGEQSIGALIGSKLCVGLGEMVIGNITGEYMVNNYGNIFIQFKKTMVNMVNNMSNMW